MGTEVITYSRIGREDIRFGKGTFEVVLADGRKVTLSEVDIGAILNNTALSTPPNMQEHWFNVYNYGARTAGADHTDAVRDTFADAVAQGGGTIVFPYLSGG